MKILSAAQTKELDNYTIEHEPILSINLMERAANTVTNWLIKQYHKDQQFKVFCGPGNNGGDGYAITRLLLDKGYNVTCYKIDTKSPESTDCIHNAKRVQTIIIDELSELPIINDCVIIDAIFGSGLSKTIEGLTEKVIDHINQSKNDIIAIDIASGLPSDTPLKGGIAIKPTFTLSFETPKLAFMHPTYSEFVGDWVCLSIGLSSSYLSKINSKNHYTQSVDNLLLSRKKFSHKNTFGHALLIGGSYGKIGAALLASAACMRSGVGLLTTHVPKCGYQILQSNIPEVMASVDEDDHYFTSDIDCSKYAAIGIGPGLDVKETTQAAFYELIKKTQGSLVIDADGLNILSRNKPWMYDLPEKTILTPHIGEFKRLVGHWSDDYEKIQLLREFCNEYNVVTVLKGAHTAVCSPNGNIHFNSTGNPGMATAGSGDVLMGIILAYLAQGLSPLNAAKVGVFKHGEAGDLVANRIGYTSMMAGDLIKALS